MNKRSAGNLLANSLLRAMAFSYNHRPKLRKYLKSTHGWINLLMGFRTENGNGRGTLGARHVYRTAVVGYEQVQAIKQGYHLVQGGFSGCDDGGGVHHNRYLIHVILFGWGTEQDNSAVFVLGDAVGKFCEPHLGPAAFARHFRGVDVDAHQEMAVIQIVVAEEGAEKCGFLLINDDGNQLSVTGLCAQRQCDGLEGVADMFIIPKFHRERV